MLVEPDLVVNREFHVRLYGNVLIEGMRVPGHRHGPHRDGGSYTGAGGRDLTNPLDDLEKRVSTGIRATIQTVFVSSFLAIIKIAAGWIGHSYALIADGIESLLDIVGSFVVWGGLRIATRPADTNHPYGHGKAESLAAMVVALGLLAAAVALAVQSIREILTPHHGPASFTLVVLLLVVITKELLYRRLAKIGLSTGAWRKSGCQSRARRSRWTPGTIGRTR